MSENGSIVLCTFYFNRVFVSKLDMSLQNVVFLECKKGHFGGRKRQMVNLGSKAPKQPRCLQNKGTTNKTYIVLITEIGLECDRKGF